MTASNAKNTLRQISLRQRMSISPADQIESAQRMTENFLSGITLHKKSVVSAYWPVRGEINAIPLLLQMKAQGHVCVLPTVTDAHSPLLFRTWEERTPMRAGVFANIPEPDPAFSEALLPDVLIIPMLGFDARGHRLGYGAGHYDRTFDVLMSVKPVLKIGVCYSFQEFDVVPTEPHDVKMDVIVTDHDVFRFDKGK